MTHKPACRDFVCPFTNLLLRLTVCFHFFFCIKGGAAFTKEAFEETAHATRAESNAISVAIYAVSGIGFHGKVRANAIRLQFIGQCSGAAEARFFIFFCALCLLEGEEA